ncbi:hypothetical protein FRC10_001688, partial [Ceratobasidium sp. 414]
MLPLPDPASLVVEPSPTMQATPRKLSRITPLGLGSIALSTIKRAMSTDVNYQFQLRLSAATALWFHSVAPS